MSQTACEKATSAGMTQLGVVQSLDSAEEHEVKLIEKHAKEHLGDSGMEAVAVTYFLVRTAVTKSVVFGIPGCHDKLKADISNSAALLRFEWKF